MNGFVTGLFTGLLSVGVIAVSPDVRPGSPPQEIPQEQKLEQVFHLEVFLRDAMEWRQNTESREVQLVRDCLTPVLNRFSEPAECAEAVRAVLTASFSGRVVIEEANDTYKAVWDPELERMVVMCCETFAAQVDIDGTIVSVPFSIGTVLD